MTAEGISEKLYETLFADEHLRAYAVLDGASVPGLPMRLFEQQPEHRCLFRGELRPDVAEVAPYVVRLDPDSDFAAWVLGEGWGAHWGVFALAEPDIDTMRRHFRTFLTVTDPKGKAVLFRFYDPRVLRLYLPTCNAGELQKIFGPVASYLLEGDDADTLLRFRPAGGRLRAEQLALTPAA